MNGWAQVGESEAIVNVGGALRTVAILGDVKAYGVGSGADGDAQSNATENLALALEKLQFSLPQADPIPYAPWVCRIGLPLGPKLRSAQ